jgi:hypothetical protein
LQLIAFQRAAYTKPQPDGAIAQRRLINELRNLRADR